MLVRRTTALALILVVVLGVSSCKKKKPPVPPPQAKAPTITQPIPEVPGTPPPISAEPSRPMPTPGETVASSTPPEPAPKPRTRVTRRTPPPQPATVEPPTPTVVPNSGTQQQGQLTASMTNDQALHQKVETEQLIAGVENKLRGMNRQLSASEEAMVQHVRAFIKQSQSATSQGDVERAYNLAVKAQQLTDELTKR